MIIDVVSESSGKDSTAALLVALETRPRENLRVAFADTGNEHELCYEYLNYLEVELEIEIVRLRADFTDWWWHRRDYIRDNWAKPHKDWPQGVPTASIERSLAVFERGPTGNPYLDLCIIKGRFPSRKAQFCTQELKTGPLVNYQTQFIDQGHAVWSWQGIRAAEGGRRAHAKEFEEVGGELYIHRPILRWTAADCFEAMRYYGIKPNPLYKLGGARVGCMPCINCSKEELTSIAKRFPEHIDRIEQWEAAVRAVGKRAGHSSFFPAPEDGRADLQGRNIRERVIWASTSRGGRQFMLYADEPPPPCSSSYGLCEAADETEAQA